MDLPELLNCTCDVDKPEPAECDFDQEMKDPEPMVCTCCDFCRQRCAEQV